MVCTRLGLLLAALLLLACPAVKSVPVDFEEPQATEDVVVADGGGCVVSNFSDLRDALTMASSGYKDRACMNGATSAVVILKCGSTVKFNRGNGALIMLDPAVKDWVIKPEDIGCTNGVKDIMIDYTKKKYNEEQAAVLHAAGGGNSFTMSNLIWKFPFKPGGKQPQAVCDSKPCAIVKVEGFKTVTFTKVSMNMPALVTAPPSRIPASGIRIKNADSITLNKVQVKKFDESGIVVEGGGVVTGTDVLANYNGKSGLQVIGCYNGAAAAQLSLTSTPENGKLPFAFHSNADSGLLANCDYSSGKAAVAVSLANVKFSKNAKQAMDLRGGFKVTATNVELENNGP